MTNFERARNVDLKTRWAGDPERWGGTSELAGTVTQNSQQLAGTQCLRANTRDLVAISWDIFCTWTIEGIVVADDQFDLFLEVSLGTGQTTSQALWVLSTKAIGGVPTLQNAGAVTLGWKALPTAAVGVYNGIAVGQEPIPAVALNARALLSIKHRILLGGDHPVKLTLQAHCCPRSWVP
jgi:hypothetical protein